MRVSRFIPPYTDKGKTAFRETFEKPGVYLIKEDGVLVYIGHSQKNLYRTMYRHFESWTHRGQKVVSYADQLRRKRYTVRVIRCTAQQAVRLERALVIRHKPRDNDNKYEQYMINFQDRQTEKIYNETEVETAPF